jgi:hypothetical protein
VVPGTTKRPSSLRDSLRWSVTMTTARDGLVSLRARVRPELLGALVDEALARRVPPGRLLSELLAGSLPNAAAERVQRQVAPARSLHAVPPLQEAHDEEAVVAIPDSADGDALAIARWSTSDVPFSPTSSIADLAGRRSKKAPTRAGA